MNSTHLLVKCITLLYRESLIQEKTDNSSDLVRTVLETIKLPEVSLSLSHEREKLMALKETTLNMCNNPLDHSYPKEELLQTLKLNCANDENTYSAFEQGIEKDMDEGSLKRTILSIKKQINDNFRDSKVIEIIGIANYKLKFERDKIKNVKELVKDLCIQLEPYQIETNRTDPAIVGSVDIGDTAKLAEVFQEVQDTASSTRVLKTGWKGFNRMTNGGIRRGEFVTVAALPHNNKTGFTLSLFRQIAVNNTPSMNDPKKKPLLLRISFEDSLLLNLEFLYKLCFENETGEKADLKNITPEEMSAYVKEKMQVNGYHIKLMRVNPSEWTYKDIQNTVLELEANGYEIHLLMLDYLPMIPTTGCEDGPMGHSTRDLCKRMRNFCSARDISLISPWQLSTTAKTIMREGHADFVKKMPGGGYYTGAQSVDNEIDLETFIHIEKMNGQVYLTIQRGKHRGVNDTADKNKYIVLPFPDDGRPILDDINKDYEITLSKVGGGRIGTTEEVPFFSFDDRK
jgi:hypothetical protein